MQIKPLKDTSGNDILPLTSSSAVMCEDGNLTTILKNIQTTLDELSASEDEDEDVEYTQLINYTMTYDAGDECSEVSGGWGDKTTLIGSWTKGILTEENGCAVLTASATAMLMEYGTENKIDVSEYSKLYGRYDFNIGTSGNGKSYVNFGLKLNRSMSSDTATHVKYTEYTESGNYVDEIDISDLDDSYYLDVTLLNYKYPTTISVRNIFLTKADNYTKLCELANVTAPSTLEELLADTTSLATIFNNEGAVKFMTRQCTGDLMVGVLNNETAVGLLKESPYLNMVVANPHWAKLMMMLPTANELLGYAMLYEEGTETELGGGCNRVYYYDTNGEVTKNADNIYFKRTDYDQGIIFKNSLDLTQYSKVCANVKNVSTTKDGITFVKCNKTSGSCGSWGMPYVPSTKKYFTEDGLISISIDELNDIPSAYNEGGYNYIGLGKAHVTFNMYHFFLTKADNFQKWCEFGGVTADSLETLVADSTAMATLMSNQKAVDYLAGCTGDLMVSICNSEVAMSALCDNIAYDTLFKHPVWRKFMLMCPTSLSVMKNVADKIPTMTSNTEPSGKVSSELTSQQACYEAFDNDNVPCGFRVENLSDGALPTWIGYQFPTPIIPFAFEGYIEHGWDSTGNSGTFTMKLQGSNDGLAWEDISSEVVWNDKGLRANYNGYAETDIQKSRPFFTNKAYTHFRFCIVSQTCTVTVYAPFVYIYCLQIYGKAVSE